MTTSLFANPLYEVLAALDLSSEAARLYQTILEHPGAPAGRLALLSKTGRGHTYNLLNDLVTSGLVQESEERGVRRFLPGNTEVIVRKVRDKITAQQQILKKAQELEPLLAALMRPSTVLPHVRLFRGEEGVKEVYEDSLMARDSKILAVADFATTFPANKNPILNRWMWQYAERRAARNIWYHGILNQSQESDRAYATRRKQKRMLKALKGVSIAVEIFLYDDKVALTSTAQDMMGVIIESGPLTSSLRALHQSMWALLPDYSGKDTNNQGPKKRA